ncbi:hypothetical protein CFE70_005398 [Pyrenophora teres f. teres 0-1]
MLVTPEITRNGETGRFHQSSSRAPKHDAKPQPTLRWGPLTCILDTYWHGKGEKCVAYAEAAHVYKRSQSDKVIDTSKTRSRLTLRAPISKLDLRGDRHSVYSSEGGTRQRQVASACGWTLGPSPQRLGNERWTVPPITFPLRLAYYLRYDGPSLRGTLMEKADAGLMHVYTRSDSHDDDDDDDDDDARTTFAGTSLGLKPCAVN